METLDPKDLIFKKNVKDVSAPVASDSSLSTSNLQLDPKDIIFEEEPSTFSDFLTAGAQGATANLYDEGVGAVKAVYDVATTDKNLEDLTSLYRQYQKMEEQKFKEAKERSPYATTAGEISGVLGTTLLGGAGLLGKTIKGVTGFNEAAEGLSLGNKILESAKIGTKVGAVSGFGGSEKTFKEGALADAIEGAAVGGLLGGAGTAALGGAKKAISSIDVKDSPFLRQSKAAYKEGLESKGFVSDKSVGERLAKEQVVAKELKDIEFNTVKTLGEQRDDLLKKAGERGENINIKSVIFNLDPILDEIEPLFKKAGDFEKLKLYLNKTKPSQYSGFELGKKQSGSLSPIEAQEIKKILNSFTYSSKESLDPKILNKLKTVENYIAENLEKIEGVAQANANINKFLLNSAETVTSKGVPVEEIIEQQLYLSNLGPKVEQKKQVYQDFYDLIRKASKPGSRTDKERKTLNALKNRLENLEKENPGFLKSIGFEKDYFLNTLQKESDLSAISQAIRGEEGTTNPLRAFIGNITPRGGAYSVANITGQGIKKAKDFGPSKLANKIFSADDGMLKTLADKLASEGNKKTSDLILNAIQNKAGISRKALLFSLLQKPDVRESLSSLIESESTEESLK
jgi:hypothetical protein